MWWLGVVSQEDYRAYWHSAKMTRSIHRCDIRTRGGLERCGVQGNLGKNDDEWKNLEKIGRIPLTEDRLQKAQIW